MCSSSNSIGEVYQKCKNNLKSYYDEREAVSIVNILFDHFFKISKTDVYKIPDKIINKHDLNKLQQALKDLKKYKPVQYITGNVEFCGLPISVDESVMIPRPETEELTYWITGKYAKTQKKLKILDIGTGSGCIAIALKKRIEDSNVFGCDISKPALELAERNARSNNASVHFINIDILKSYQWKKLKQSFDLIISNPPYVLESEKKIMNSNVLEYEPENALFVDDNDPLIFYEKILEFTKKYLQADGVLYLEINEKFGNELKKRIGKRFDKVILKKDLNGKARFISAFSVL